MVYQSLSGEDKHADFASVARVQPRTSKGITDLLLLNLVRLNTENPSKKWAHTVDNVRTI